MRTSQLSMANEALWHAGELTDLLNQLSKEGVDVDVPAWQIVDTIGQPRQLILERIPIGSLKVIDGRMAMGPRMPREDDLAGQITTLLMRFMDQLLDAPDEKLVKAMEAAVATLAGPD